LGARRLILIARVNKTLNVLRLLCAKLAFGCAYWLLEDWGGSSVCTVGLAFAFAHGAWRMALRRQHSAAVAITQRAIKTQ
jgi:hypothetical protein